jgi:cyclic pyranopterin phosphate synthase
MTSSKKADLVIYSDGGAIGNPGPGGFGVVIEAEGKNWQLLKGYRRTTNNRMELMGVIAGLESTAEIGHGRQSEVVSDSRYVVDGMSKGWAARWRANGWRRNKRGEKALNPDLWGRLLDAVEGRDVAFRWIKGHAGHPQNERCDAMVQEASALPRSEQDVDVGYEPKGHAMVARSAPFESVGVRLGSSLRGNDVRTRGNDGGPRRDDASLRANEHRGVKIRRELTHIDSSGEARMVNVGGKAVTERAATAGCDVLMSAQTMSLIRTGGIGKGDVIATAKLAGVMGAKRTSELIPMCHNIPLSQIEVDIDDLPDGSGLKIEATARAVWRTGVEMEAMTAASVAALTVYDMCKSAERGIRVTNLRLLRKSGGKSGEYVAG